MNSRNRFDQVPNSSDEESENERSIDENLMENDDDDSQHEAITNIPDIGQTNPNWLSFLAGFKSKKVYENVINDYAIWQDGKEGDYIKLLIQYFDYLLPNR
jgi:hypothetical protein